MLTSPSIPAFSYPLHSHAEPRRGGDGGLGVSGCLKALERRDSLRWLSPVILFLAALFQWHLTRSYPEWNRPMTLALSAVSSLSLGIMAARLIRKRSGKSGERALFAGLLALAILPFSWSLTPLLYGGDPGIPYGRPDLKETKVGETFFQINCRDDSEYEMLLSYLGKNRGGEDFMVGVKSALDGGADLMLLTEGDVMALGGFSGTDPILSMEEIEALVEGGTIRFFLMTSGGSLLNRAGFWVMAHGRIVPESERKREGDLKGLVLYDCRPERGE